MYNLISVQFLACAILVIQPFFSADRFSDAAPITATGQSFYKLIVTFKKQLSSEDQSTIIKTMALMASKPIAVSNREVTLKPPTFPTVTSGEVDIIIVGQKLSNSDKDSVEQFASNLVDSYVTRHGNAVASAAVTDADPPGGSRLHDEVQKIIDSDIINDILAS